MKRSFYIVRIEVVANGYAVHTDNLRGDYVTTSSAHIYVFPTLAELNNWLADNLINPNFNPEQTT